MREILFRGKRIYDEKWIYGNLVIDNFFEPHIVPRDFFFEDGHHLVYDDETDSPVFVFKDSIGQYTGLKDKNGLTKIFEYDIIDANGRKVGNYYENSNLLKDGTCLLVARMGTKEWSRSEQEAIKRGCKYAE